MKNKKVLLFALALAAGVLLRGGHAFAATSTWTGAGGDTNMNTAGNWDSAPVGDGTDDLVFPASVSNKTVVNNYADNTVFHSITFSGTGSGMYSLTGTAPINLAAGITNSSDIRAAIELNIVLTADQSFTTSGNSSSRMDIGKADGSRTLNLGSYTLTTAFGSSSAWIELRSLITGTGNLASTGTGTLLLGQENNTFNGSVNLGNTGLVMVNAPAGFGAGSSSVTIPSSVSLDLNFDGSASPVTMSRAMTFNSDLILYANLMHESFQGGGAGACDNSNTLVLSGAIVLGADVKVSGCATLKITGALSGAHTVTPLEGDLASVIVASSANTSSTSNGTVSAAVKSTTYADNSPSGSIGVLQNNIAVVTGTYGAVDIEGGILKGTGTVGLVNLYSGIIAPGMSPGVLNTGELSFTGGEYQAELGGTGAGQFDQLNATGAVGLGSATTLTVSRYNNFKPKAGDKFTIINNDGSDAVTGTFKGLAEGATWKVDGYVLSITYKGGDGNDVVVTVASVPATPNTGFGLMLNNPAMLLGLTSGAAVTILLVSRRLATKKVRR